MPDPRTREKVSQTIVIYASAQQVPRVLDRLQLERISEPFFFLFLTLRLRMYDADGLKWWI